MTRRPVLGLALAALFGISLTLPCFTMGSRDEVPMGSMAGCAGEATPQADLVCATNFTPAPSHEGLQSISLAVVKIPATPPILLSTREGLDAPPGNPVALEHAPPAYLLHNAFLI